MQVTALAVRDHRDRAWLWWLKASLAWLLINLPLQAHASPVLELNEAWFDAQGVSAQIVSLPDTWRQRDLLPRGEGRYRFLFNAPTAASDESPWALRTNRLSRWHRVWLNGALIASSPDTPALRRQASPSLAWIDLPAGLLHAGQNELVVEVFYQRRGGLTPLRLGPVAELEAEHRWEQLKGADLPQGINLVAAGFSLLLLLVWLERRHEKALGLFAMLILLTSLRNCLYGVELPHRLAHAADLFFYGAQVLSVMLLCSFALAWSERWHVSWIRSLWGLAGALLAAGAWASSRDVLESWRTWSYPVLIPLALAALALILRRAARVGGWRRMALGAALLMLVLGGIFDYLVGQGLVGVSYRYTLPWLQPLAMMAFGSLMAERLVLALQQSEQLQSHLERLVTERTAELQAAHLAKGRLLDAASHDLRQPVTAIGLLVGMARHKAADPGIRALLDQARDGIQGLEQLLKALLDHARVSQPNAPPLLRSVPVQPMLESIRLHAEPLAQARGLALRVRASKACVWSDPILLEQMLRNLVGNAVEHCRQGRILVALRRRQGKAWLQVLDTGPGIALEDQRRIFEPFVRLGGLDVTREHGVGLGLAIVQHAAKLLGHTLHLQSRPGHGSSFTIELPLAPIAPPKRQAISTPQTTAETSAALPPSSVWLVEDDDALREALAAQLRQWGQSTLSFPNAEALLAHWQGHAAERPTWVISDCRLPGMSGQDLLDRLAQDKPGLHGLIISADAPVTPTHSSRHWPLLQKPFGPNALEAVLRSPANRANSAPGRPTV